MTASTLITDYVGRGTLAARPSSPPVGSAAGAIYVATDTGQVFAWNGTGWQALAGTVPAATLKSESGTGGVTLTAAELVPASFPGKVLLLRSGPTANFSDTTDTAADLVAAISGAAVDSLFEFVVFNISAHTETIQPGTGVTFAGATDSGNFTLTAGSSRSFWGVLTNIGSPAVTLYG